ncbi:hypothetical protein [Bacteroides cellulosilyticus]|jgi:hypothetical protein|uniref:hypothetical protein n=1 Tax=Bacteroides cellulosilyticus TaxID=246787 RepID=UPI001D06B650|nr:hypothetical protein [Bacteroides cellulosilyticus]MCB6590905.1 hypothetical protein [Bacteroides cellulosilyticus]DAN43055.1 MAG TPA: hypothetical protein [Caudoviricetes sp.]DAO48614.1 MAG TPA: hypothetical protein [Caudoviricetes sp.]
MDLSIFIFCAGVALLILVLIAVCDVSVEGHKRPAPPRIPCPPKLIMAPGMKYQRLTIKAIIRWEQLREKSFSLMDYTDKEDMESLLYVIYITSDKPGYTFEVFRQVIADERFMSAMSSDLGRIMEIVAQFQKKIVPDLGSTEGSPEYIGNIVSALIMAGLDAHYALNEMELCDLPLYLEAYERKRKEEMESSRMWTYFTMLPHIDARKMKNGARDLIVFPWEEEEMRKEAERAIREDAARFEEFMKTKKTDYYGG